MADLNETPGPAAEPTAAAAAKAELGRQAAALIATMIAIPIAYWVHRQMNPDELARWRMRAARQAERWAAQAAAQCWQWAEQARRAYQDETP